LGETRSSSAFTTVPRGLAAGPVSVPRSSLDPTARSRTKVSGSADLIDRLIRDPEIETVKLSF
jgi:hypothetical protein